MLVKTLKLAAICTVLLVVPLQAHHSHGNYDTTKWTTMEGKVTEVHYLVPHSWLYVEVKDQKGEPTVWAMEATGYGGLFRVGVKREDLKAGDIVSGFVWKIRSRTAAMSREPDRHYSGTLSSDSSNTRSISRIASAQSASEVARVGPHGQGEDVPQEVRGRRRAHRDRQVRRHLRDGGR